ncbi:hypothetical protein GCM10028801_30780 [Nocardioides maradonensis]
MLKSFVARAFDAVVSVCALVDTLNAKQRKLIYKVAAAGGLYITVRIAQALGWDVASVTDDLKVLGALATTVLVPVLAHYKVSGD